MPKVLIILTLLLLSAFPLACRKKSGSSTSPVSVFPTPTNINGYTSTPTYSPTATETPTSTLSPTPTIPGGATSTPASFTPTYSPTPTHTPTLSFTPTLTYTDTPTFTQTPTPTLTPTPTPCVNTAFFGTSTGNLNTWSAEATSFSKYVLAQGSMVYRMRLMDSRNGSLRTGIYADNGSGTAPTTLITVSASVNPPSGGTGVAAPVTLDVPDVYLPAGTYWLAVYQNGAWTRALSTAGYECFDVQGSMPQTFIGAFQGYQRKTVMADYCF